jgi:hypothetical protein
VQVVEEDDQRLAVSERDEKLSGGPEPLFAGSLVLAQADQHGNPLGGALRILLALELRADLGACNIARIVVGDAGGVFDEFEDRPERDPVSVGETTRAQHPRPGLHLGQRFGDEA